MFMLGGRGSTRAADREGGQSGEAGLMDMMPPILWEHWHLGFVKLVFALRWMKQ